MDLLATIFESQGAAIPTPGDYAQLPWPFVRDGADAALARDALAAAIAKLVEEPAIDAAIEEATERFDIAEQERLRNRKVVLAERLRELTSRQTA